MAETACHCGQLRLTVEAPPVHVHFCTCTRCQRASGSVGGWNGWFPKAAVTVHGRTSLYLIEGPDHPEAFAAFCPNCGSGGYSTTPGYLDECWVSRWAPSATPRPRRRGWCISGPTGRSGSTAWRTCRRG